MPCDTIQTSTLNVGTMNRELLTRALQQLGFSNVRETASGLELGTYGKSGTYNAEAGTLEISGRTGVTVDDVKQAYSREAVKVAAAKFGWKLTENTSNANKFVAVRRF